MTNKKGSRYLKFFQRSLFDHPTDDVESLVESELDNIQREKILIPLLALQSVKGIGLKTLYDIYDSELLSDFDKLKLDEKYFREKYSKTIKKQLLDEIFKKYDYLIESAFNLEEIFDRESIEFIPSIHQYFPKSLYRMNEPPRWLFVKGDLNAIISDYIIGIVGTRDPSHIGRRLSFHISKEFVKRNFIVLSGFAKGIDKEAHRGAVEYYGQSIAVLGHGFNSKYSNIDKKLEDDLISNDGAIITEYFPSEFPSSKSFLRRNEIIASMSKLIIPVETYSIEKSGTGATIRRAKKIGTPVIGVMPPNSNSNNLQNTLSGLKEIGYESYEFSTSDENGLWMYINKLFPNHKNDDNLKERQERYFKHMLKLAEANKKDVLQDDKSIDELAEYLRIKLKE